MNKYIFVFLLLFLLNNSAYTRTVIVSGKLEAAIEKTVTLEIVQNGLTNDRLIYKADLNEKNEFAIFLEIKNLNWLGLNYGKQKIDVFVASNQKEVKFICQANDMSNSIFFSDEKAMNNNFLADYRRLYRINNSTSVKYKTCGLSADIDTLIVQRAKAYLIDDYFTTLGTDFDDQKQFLFRRNSSLDPLLFNYMQKEIRWRYEQNKIAYFLYNEDHLESNQVRNAWYKYGVLQTVDINDDESVESAQYQNLLNAFMHYLYLESPSGGKDVDFSYYRFINGNLSGRTRYYMLAKLMLRTYQEDGNPRLAQRKFKAYKRDCPYPDYVNSLKEYFGNNLEYVPKITINNFKVLDFSEREVWLSDYSGKVVYISFWASWCGPCLKGFRETSAVRQELERAGVVFLNINIDDDFEIFQKVTRTLNTSGLHVFAHDLVSLRNAIKFSAIPHYVVINKSGMQTYLSSEDLNDSVNDFYKLLRE